MYWSIASKKCVQIYIYTTCISTILNHVISNYLAQRQCMWAFFYINNSCGSALRFERHSLSLSLSLLFISFFSCSALPLLRSVHHFWSAPTAVLIRRTKCVFKNFILWMSSSRCISNGREIKLTSVHVLDWIDENEEIHIYVYIYNVDVFMKSECPFCAHSVKHFYTIYTWILFFLIFVFFLTSLFSSWLSN